MKSKLCTVMFRMLSQSLMFSLSHESDFQKYSKQEMAWSPSSAGCMYLYILQTLNWRRSLMIICCVIDSPSMALALAQNAALEFRLSELIYLEKVEQIMIFAKLRVLKMISTSFLIKRMCSS